MKKSIANHIKNVLRTCVRIVLSLLSALKIYIRIKRRHHEGEKLILISHEIRTSGASMLLSQIANRLCSLNYDIVLLVANGFSIDRTQLSKLDSRILLVPMYGMSAITDTVIRFLRHQGYNLAIGNTILSGMYAPLLKKAGIRSTFLIHEMEGSCAILQASAHVCAIMADANHVIFPSDIARDSLLKYCHWESTDKVTIIPQGNYKRQLTGSNRQEAHEKVCQKIGIPSNSIIFIGAGAVNFGKGVDQLVSVLVELLERELPGHEYHLLWLGLQKNDDPYSIWLNLHIRNSGIENRWHWIGYVDKEDEYIRYLEAATVFLLPSREDSYPSVAIEAASLGVPVVAFSGSGGATRLVQRQHGYIAKSGSIRDFCKKIELIIQNYPSISEKCNEFLPQLSQEADFDSYVSKIIQVLKDEA